MGNGRDPIAIEKPARYSPRWFLIQPFKNLSDQQMKNTPSLLILTQPG